MLNDKKEKVWGFPWLKVKIFFSCWTWPKWGRKYTPTVGYVMIYHYTSPLWGEKKWDELYQAQKTREIHRLQIVKDVLASRNHEGYQSSCPCCRFLVVKWTLLWLLYVRFQMKTLTSNTRVHLQVANVINLWLVINQQENCINMEDFCFKNVCQKYLKHLYQP